jgi:hypothetical protein
MYMTLYSLIYESNFFFKIKRLLDSKIPCEYFLVYQNLFKISIKSGSILFSTTLGTTIN